MTQNLHDLILSGVVINMAGGYDAVACLMWPPRGGRVINKQWDGELGQYLCKQSKQGALFSQGRSLKNVHT